MHIIQNITLKKNVVKKILPLVMALLQGIKNLFGPLLMTWTADSPTRRYGESAKTSENSVHYHVPLIKFFWVNCRY
jgi:hypothetical protein